MTPICHNKQTHHSFQFAREGRCSPSVKGRVSKIKRRVCSALTESNVSRSDVCSTNNNSAHYTPRTAWRENGASKMWPCADQAFCPSPPPRLYMESNDLSLWKCGVRSITRDICDTACILDMHLHGVNLSVKPSHRQDIHITIHVQQLQQGSCMRPDSDSLTILHKINCVSVNLARACFTLTGSKLPNTKHTDK